MTEYPRIVVTWTIMKPIPPHLKKLAPVFGGSAAFLLPFTFVSGWVGSISINLFTEVIGTAVILFIVDQWIHQVSNAEKKPARQALIAELDLVQDVISRYIGETARILLVEDDQGSQLRNNDSDKLSEVLGRIQVDQLGPIMLTGPEMKQGTHRQAFELGVKPLLVRMREIMPRYSHFLEPDLMFALHAVDDAGALAAFERGHVYTWMSGRIPASYWSSVILAERRLREAILRAKQNYELAGYRNQAPLEHFDHHPMWFTGSESSHLDGSHLHVFSD